MNHDVEAEESLEDLRDEIAELEVRLRGAKERLGSKSGSQSTTTGTAPSSSITSGNPPYDASSAQATASPPPPPHAATATPSYTLTSPPPLTPPLTPDPDHHFLLLLSDSALPLGSFAFSSGLESWRAHARASAAAASVRWGPARTSSSSSSSSSSAAAAFESAFLPLSVSSFAAANLPFALAAHRRPARLPELDDALDASTVCAVARRASVAQGRALLAVWERSFAPAVKAEAGAASRGGGGGGGGGGGDEDEEDPVRALKRFGALVRRSSSYASSRGNPPASSSSSSAAAAAAAAAAARAGGPTTTRGPDKGEEERDEEDEEDEDEDEDIPRASAHLAPLFGAVARALGLTAAQAAHALVLGHARAAASAAMRAGVLEGPFQAQRILAGAAARRLVADAVARAWHVPVVVAAAAPDEHGGPAAAGFQTAPALELWAARHEILYSKIFNS